MSAARRSSAQKSPTERICGPAAAAKASPKPSSASRDAAPAETNPPQTLSRGNWDFSASATDHPARASNAAAVAPAGPPPITSASKRRTTPRDEEMAEEAARAFLEEPLAARRPHTRQFI